MNYPVTATTLRALVAPKAHKDHIVELQLIAQALNNAAENGYKYSQSTVHGIVLYFAEFHNIQLLTPEQNIAKRNAVQRLINAFAALPGDTNYIRNTWQQLRNNVPGNAPNFRREMNILLALPPNS